MEALKKYFDFDESSIVVKSTKDMADQGSSPITRF